MTVDRDGTIMGQEVVEFGTVATPQGFDRFTVYARWTYGDPDIDPGEPGALSSETEEIDVDARTEVYAHALARKILDRDYEPDWEITDIRKRFGLYL